MAYTINLSDGSIYATIQDGTINYDNSTITVIGKNFEGYGEFIGENFMRALENSANASAPTNMLRGQLWFDTNNNALVVNSGTVAAPDFKTLGTVAAQGTEPAVNARAGDMWYDTVNQQLTVFDGTSYVLVGPLYSTPAGKSGPIVETITDTASIDHTATVNYVGGDVLSISHKDPAFTPLVPIAGFPPPINPGIQLADSILGQTPKFVGTATNADFLEGFDSDQFVRSDIPAETMDGTLSILDDGGLKVGVDSDLVLDVNSIDTYITNANADGNMFLRTRAGTSQPETVLTLHGASTRARVLTPIAGTDIANMDYVDTTTVALDGSRILTGDLDLGNNRITSLGAATQLTDAMSLGESDGRYVKQEISTNVNTNGTTLLRVYNEIGAYGSINGQSNTLQVFQPTAGRDAFQSFHVGGDYAVHFGLDGTTNDLFVGGWSKGAVKHKIWHQGNDGAGSGLSADNLDGYHHNSFLKKSEGYTKPVLFSTPSLRYSIYGVAGTKTYSKTLSYYAPAGTTHVLLRIRMSTLGVTDFRYMIYTINGRYVAGGGSDDTDQSNTSRSHTVSEVWVNVSEKSGYWSYQVNGGPTNSTYISIHQIGYMLNVA